MDMSLSKLQEIVKDREGWRAAVHGVTKGWTWLSDWTTTTKWEIDSNTVIVGDFNSSLTSINRSSIQKVNKETEVLNETVEQIDLIGSYTTFHLNVAEYMFLSSAYGTFSRKDYLLGQKTSLNKFKKIEIISGTFSNHSGMKLVINYKNI